jgi:tetratricopeptide (TPR) repeat protein
MTIYGLGGCGKSALALEFAYRALARHARSLVFWVPAISLESFELAYWEIGVRLRIPGINDDNANVRKLVKDALSLGSSGDWLMIVDNADDAGVLFGTIDNNPMSTRLNDCLPHSNRGTILFTTRSRKVAGDLTPSSVLELNDMSKAEARQLLARRLMKQGLLDNETAVNELLERLTYLPLAIVQAAAFINNNDISVSGYISLFQHIGTESELFSERFEDPSRYREMDSTIAKTWHISFDQLRRQDRLAAEYLSFMACIDRVNIPQSLLPPGGSLVQQAKALGTLTGYAFITERQQTVQELGRERFFDMHRLVHIASAWWLDGHNERVTWSSRAVTQLIELVPAGGHERKEIWTKYLPHAIYMAGLSDTVDDLTRASLLDRVGHCQLSLGQYSAAETAHRQALLLREKRLGKEHTQTLASTNGVGIIRITQDKYEEAEAINRQTPAQKERVPWRDHPDTLASMSNLALVLSFQGKYEEAEAMNRQTLARKEMVLGSDHPDTLTTMANLALVLNYQGKYEEAEAMNRQTLAQKERVLGCDHPETLMTMTNLAVVLKDQGKYEEAEAINRQTLAQQEIVLGSDHPGTLTSMNNLAVVLDYQCKYGEAEATFRQALAQQERVLGGKHPDTLATMANLALVLYYQGKYEEAEAMNRQTLAQEETLLGRDHPRTLVTMSNLALVLIDLGKYEEAEAMNRQTLAQQEIVLGSDHPGTLTSMGNLAVVLDYQRKYGEAEATYRQTLAQRETVLGRDHPDTLLSVYHLACLLEKRHHYDESLILYERASTAYPTVLGNDHPTTRACRQRYSEALASQKQDRCTESHDASDSGPST